MAVGRFFFFAAPTAQNNPELHFRFINAFIQPSLLGYLFKAKLQREGIFFLVHLFARAVLGFSNEKVGNQKN